VSVFSLSADETIKHWPRFRHHLERLERETGLVLASSVRADLATGSKQLWGYEEGDILGVAITEVIQTPKGPCCWIYGACGTESRKGQIDAIIASIEAWAKGIGCSRVMLQGRHGWRRKLDGYKDVGVILEKEF
jgi:hypothetical protein